MTMTSPVQGAYELLMQARTTEDGGPLSPAETIACASAYALCAIAEQLQELVAATKGQTDQLGAHLADIKTTIEMS